MQPQKVQNVPDSQRQVDNCVSSFEDSLELSEDNNFVHSEGSKSRLISSLLNQFFEPSVWPSDKIFLQDYISILSPICSIKFLKDKELLKCDARLVLRNFSRERVTLQTGENEQRKSFKSERKCKRPYKKENFKEEEKRNQKLLNEQTDQAKRINHRTRIKSKPNLLLDSMFLVIFTMCLYFSPNYSYHSNRNVLNNLLPSRVNFAIALNVVDLSISTNHFDNKQGNNLLEQHNQKVTHIRKNRQENSRWSPTTAGSLSLTSSSNSTQFQEVDYTDTYSRLDSSEDEPENELKYISTPVFHKSNEVTTENGHSTSNWNENSNYTTPSSAILDDDSLSATTLMDSLFRHIDKQWKFAEVILIIVISAILNLFTIIGNIMVLISFKMDRSLQTVSNYFLLSLALADLLIGLISMPLYTLYLLLNYWPLGPLMCDIWLAIDYLNSNAAVLNMLIISFDRYFSVTRPLTYRAKRTTKHACLMISCAWILSLTIWTPAIFTYPRYKGRTVQGTDKCEIEFVKANTYLTFVTAILAFYIPVAIMIYLYWRIWLETKKRYRDLTTLFLVSGVGAAAPVRTNRPPLQQLTGSTTTNSAIATGQQKNSTAFRRQVSVRGSTATTFTEHNNKERINLPLTTRELTNKTSRKTAPDLNCLGEEAAAAAPEKQKQIASIAREVDNNKMTISPDALLISTTILPAEERFSPYEQQLSNSPTSLLNYSPSSSVPKGGRCLYTCCPRNNIKLKKTSSKCPYRFATTSSGNNCSPSKCAKCIQVASAKQAIAVSKNQSCHLCDTFEQAKRISPSFTQPAPGSSTTEAPAITEYKVHIKRDHHHHHHGHYHTCRYRHHHHHHKPAQHMTIPVTCAQLNSSTKRSSPHYLHPHPHQDHHQHQHRHHHPHHHHHHHHHHQHRHHHHHHHHQHRKCSPNCRTERKQHTISPSILSSGYQLLSSTKNSGTGNKSRSCASIIRKVHPSTANTYSNQQDDQTFGAGKHYSPVEVSDGNNNIKCISLSCISLPCTEQSKNVVSFKEMALSDTKSTFATAAHNSSPLIQYPAASPADESDDEVTSEDYERDFETRIVSEGDKFRFESAHLKAESSSTRGSANKLASNDKLARQQQAYSTFRGTRNDCHYCRKVESRCCGKIKIYSTHCCLCSPSSKYCHATRPIDHAGCSISAVSRSPTDCKQCQKILNSRASSSLSSKVINRQTINNNKNNYTESEDQNGNSGSAIGNRKDQEREEVALEQSNNARLPILDALRNVPEQLTSVNESGEKALRKNITDSWIQLDSPKKPSSNLQRKDNLKKAGKKFSQKLTFSDIIVATDRDSSKRVKAEGPIKKHSAEGTSSFAELSIPKTILEQNDGINASDSNKKGWLARLTRSNSFADIEEERRSTKSSQVIQLFRNVFCCNSGQQLKETRFSSNDSSSHKNSSSDDSETTAYQTKSMGINSQSNNVNSASSKPSYSSHHPIQPKSERKAAKTLSTLLLVFIVTWLPYNILVLMKTLSGVEDQVPEKIWNFSYYLCYINSTINPLCYALCNAQFRRTYMRILKCKLSNEHNSTRRLVPLQSSANWNKDLRITATDPNDSNFRHNSQQLLHRT